MAKRKPEDMGPAFEDKAHQDDSINEDAMPALKRVALFSIGDNVHLNQLLGLQRGFQQIGIECFAGMDLPTGPQLSLFVDSWKPDLIFEWDRSRAQITDFDDRITHAVWIQNHQTFFQSWNKGYGGSNLIYSHIPPSVFGFDIADDEFHWLFPGADDAIFGEGSNERIYDVVLAGHMYAPLTLEDLNKTCVIEGRSVGQVGPLVAAYVAADFHAYNCVLPDIHAFLLDRFRRYIPNLALEDVPSEILHFFDERLLRLVDRKIVVDGILAATKNVAFYGAGEWTKWDAYTPYYRGLLNRPHELADAYRSAWICIHDAGSGMHHRTMEVMACGRALFVNHNRYGGTLGDIAHYFEPDKEFIWYHHNSIGETLTESLRDKERLRRIGQNAARRIREGHLWRHRAAQIARDFEQL